MNVKIDHYYNGNGRIFIDSKDWGADGFHEMSHYQLCSPYRRKHPEYGLGHPVHGIVQGECPQLLSASMNEEEQASMLGVYYEWFYGANPGYTLENHNWIENGWKTKDTFSMVNSVLNGIRWLISKGFISEDLTPTFKLRDWEDDPKNYGRDSNAKDVDGSRSHAR